MCLVTAVTLLVAGLLIPAHLRAVDDGVIRRAGQSSPALLEQGQNLAGEDRLGTAQMLAQAAQAADMAGWDRLGLIVTNLAGQNPQAVFWGNDSRTAGWFPGDLSAPECNELRLSDFMVRQKNREAALVRLHDSPVPAVAELRRTRSLSNTVLFPPSQSAAGQAYDTAVAIAGLLLDGNRLTPNLSTNLFTLASAANHGDSSQPLEQALMDFLSLGERFNWDQLTAFTEQIPDVGTLHALTGQAQQAGDQLPVLFAAVQLSGNPSAVAAYNDHFKSSGLTDLAAGLRYGAGGVNALAETQQRFYRNHWLRQVTAYNPFGEFYYSAASVAFHEPYLAMTLKCLCYLLAGFFIGAAAHQARPRVTPLEQPLQVRGFHLIREFLFSVGFLLVVLLLSEPFLAQENLKGNVPFRLVLPMAGGTVPAGIASLHQTVMNPVILLTLLIFFVLQALLYIACLVKLAEIRRQQIPPRMKLKLLENEDHLFDAGLYLGFVGTIVSLIIASMGLVKFSLMAAYSSTSFGIVFVVVFKIFHLRPARRTLLLEAEIAEARPGTAPAMPPVAA